MYLSLPELLYVAERATGEKPLVRDAGLLEAAVARPQASVFGEPAYPTSVEKAAALVHWIARNHALVDGNERLSLGALIAFLGINGYRLTFTNDEAYDLIIAIAAGELDEVKAIAVRIEAGIELR